MKTPREILLARHRTATPKLAALRQQVVQGIEAKERAGTPAREEHSWWWATRWQLAAMAAVWIITLAFQLDRKDSLAPMAATASPPSKSLLAALRENRRHLVELLQSAPGAELQDSPSPSATREVPLLQHRPIRGPASSLPLSNTSIYV